VRSHFDDIEQVGNAQRIVMAVDVVPGPFAPEIAARLLHLIVEELRAVGADIVAVNLEIQGDIASW
jgi:hypothetical protein